MNLVTPRSGRSGTCPREWWIAKAKDGAQIFCFKPGSVHVGKYEFQCSEWWCHIIVKYVIVTLTLCLVQFWRPMNRLKRQGHDEGSEASPLSRKNMKDHCRHCSDIYIHLSKLTEHVFAKRNFQSETTDRFDRWNCYVRHIRHSFNKCKSMDLCNCLKHFWQMHVTHPQIFSLAGSELHRWSSAMERRRCGECSQQRWTKVPDRKRTYHGETHRNA